MKKFLKVLVTLSVIAALLLSFAGCKKDEKKEESKPAGTKNESSAKAAEETVTKFMDALSEANFKEAFSYTDDEFDFKDTGFEEAADAECEGEDDFVELTMEEMPSEFEDYGLEEDYRDAVEKSVKVRFDGMSYEIAESEEKDGVSTVKVTYEYYSADEREVIAENFEEALTAAQEELNNSYEAGEMTLDDANGLFYEYYIEEINNMTDDMKDCDTEEVTLEFSLYEKDGEWIISAVDSDLSKLEKFKTE